MTENLGYAAYLAQGGDWGGAISSWLGFEHSAACKAIHINILTMRHPDGPQTDMEHAWAEQFVRDQILQDGYRTQQATRPQTLGYAMGARCRAAVTSQQWRNLTYSLTILSPSLVPCEGN